MQGVMILFLILCSLVRKNQGGLLNLSVEIRNCDIIFKWDNSFHHKQFDVLITKDNKAGNWTKFYKTQFTVSNVQKYEDIAINVRIEGNGTDNVLNYKVKPMKPIISGKRDIPIGSYTELTCSVQCYNSTRNHLSYTWFENNEKLDLESKTLGFNVTEDHRNKKYSCAAAKGELQSNRSEPVQINPLYIFSPQHNSATTAPFWNKEILIVVALIASVILVMIVASAVVLYFLKTNKNDNGLENPKVDTIEVENEQPLEHPTSALYAAVDKTLLKKRRSVDDDVCGKKDTHVQNEEGRLSTTMSDNKADILKPDVTEKAEGSKNPSAETCKNSASSHLEGLIYIDVEFVNKTENPDTNTHPQIHGDEERTEYTFVDFSKSAQPDHGKPETEGK